MADTQNMQLRKSDAGFKTKPRQGPRELKTETLDLGFDSRVPPRIMSPPVKKEGLGNEFSSQLDLFSDTGGAE